MAESRELGTLIVVVGKAKNLPNKSRFGKQDPFCTVKVGEEKQRTKAIKRGGQHPEWDEELRFNIMEDVDDVLTRSESQPDTSLSSSTSLAPDFQPGVTTAAALASKSRKGPISKKGEKSMRVACYADDAKEPELIGECVVSIEEVLKKGEVDEWYEYLYKDKYSGEVYLELTFYSNDNPPVKRNVPRPSVHAYGGAGPIPSSSSSLLVGRHRSSGGLTASGSVSGMSLYIPPYAQPPRVPSPSPQPVPTSSFAELGLPQDHRRKQSLPVGLPNGHNGKSADIRKRQTSSNHLGYTPTPQSYAPHPTQSAMDALTRPMSSMSLGISHSSRPLPSASPLHQASHPGHAMGSRHSVGGPSEAPWGSLLPQSQQPTAPAPHPRPVSSSDALPWEQMQRLMEDRRTPVPRPASGQGSLYSAYQQDRPIYASLPSSLSPAAPPVRPDADGFSQASGPPGPSIYRYPSPGPPPPPHASSAPPVATVSNHYQIPASSYAGLAQQHVGPIRMPSPRPGYQQLQEASQQHDTSRISTAPYPPHNPSVEFDYNEPYGRPSSRNDSYPRHPPSQQDQQDHQGAGPSFRHASIPPPSQTPQPYPQNPPVHSVYPSSQQQDLPPLQPSPAPPPQGGYVPWYQQTQSTVQPSPAQSGQQYDQSYDHQYTQYGSSPPSAPSRRPVPHPPAPQRPQFVGYYPSDELYVMQRPQTPQTPPQSYSTPDPWIQQQSYPPQPQAHDPYYYPPQPSTQSYTPSPGTFSPQHSHAAPPFITEHAPQGCQPGMPEFNCAPSPQPPAQNYYSQHPQHPNLIHSHSQPRPPLRAPSPQPPLNHTNSAPNGWQPQLVVPDPRQSSLPDGSHRSPSPSPSGRQDWRSYMQNLPAPTANTGSPPRSPSPQPAPKDQQTWYTPPPSLPASIRPPEGWRSTLPAQANGHQWRG